MARDWRRLALAAMAVAAVGSVCVFPADAQTPAKSSAKKAKAAPTNDAEAQEGEAPRPTKKKKQDPVQAQQAIDGAAKQLETGKAEQAVQALTAVLTGGNLPPAIMAKALFYRGIAYRQRKMPAQAIADLTSALWLKGGLSERDRADALRQRSSAYQEAGLTEVADQSVAAAVPGASPAPTRTASVGKSWGTSTSATPAAGEREPAVPATSREAPPAPAQTGGWGIPNPFAGLFASAPSTAADRPAPAAPETTASIPDTAPSAAPATARRQTSAWSRNTEVHSGATPAVAAKPEGRFRIQVGMVRDEDQARQIAAKVEREHAAVVTSRQTQIDQAVVGNMGSFYRVRVGPFASQQEGQAACAKLRGSGLDCLVVAQ
jgi:hypothetical protein